MTKDEILLALTVKCRYCGAGVNSPCHSRPQWLPIKTPHKMRLDRAKYNDKEKSNGRS